MQTICHGASKSLRIEPLHSHFVVAETRWKR